MDFDTQKYLTDSITKNYPIFQKALTYYLNRLERFGRDNEALEPLTSYVNERKQLLDEILPRFRKDKPDIGGLVENMPRYGNYVNSSLHCYVQDYQKAIDKIRNEFGDTTSQTLKHMEEDVRTAKNIIQEFCEDILKKKGWL